MDKGANATTTRSTGTILKIDADELTKIKIEAEEIINEIRGADRRNCGLEATKPRDLGYMCFGRFIQEGKLEIIGDRRYIKDLRAPHSQNYQ